MLLIRASTSVFLKTSNMCSGCPQPPDAIMGMREVRQIALFNLISYPFSVPSASMLVRRISPAPRDSTLLAHSMASIPVPSLPP